MIKKIIFQRVKLGDGNCFYCDEMGKGEKVIHITSRGMYSICLPCLKRMMDKVKNLDERIKEIKKNRIVDNL